MSYVSLKLCYGASKKSCFAFSLGRNRIQDEDENYFEKSNRKKRKKIYKGEVFLIEMRNELKSSGFGYFKNTQGNDSATNLLR